MPVTTAVRGPLLHFLDDPARKGAAAWEYFPDGLLWVENGVVRAAGPAARLLKRLPRRVKVARRPGKLIVPGFVDCHVHFPQMEMIGSYGEQLLEWLEKYTFPTERRFASKTYARREAKRFLKELLRNGTTTAMVFSTVHTASTEALFEEAARADLRLITGKVLMDAAAPAYLRDDVEHGIRDSRRLIEKWHGRGRLRYAVTPRFALTSSRRQLEAAGRLLAEYPGVYMQTHLSENKEEVRLVRKRFPRAKNYFDVYARAGLAGAHSVFAHCVHLSAAEWGGLAKSGSAIAYCPTSNLFLGSGLFDLREAARRRVAVGMGSDVGAGTSFSIFQNLNEAYKIAQLRGQRLDAFRAFYLATLGGARALRFENQIGNFLPGKEADFTVLDPEATPLMALRNAKARDLQERLFLLMTLGDDRTVAETYVMGKPAHRR